MKAVIILASLLGVKLSGGYFAGPTAVEWETAEAYCESQGTTLASIQSDQELIDATTVCRATGAQWGCHIGLRMPSYPGPWEWIDGSAINYGFNNGDGSSGVVPPWFNTAAFDGSSTQTCGYIYSGTDPYTFEDVECSGRLDDYGLLPPLCNGQSSTTPSPTECESTTAYEYVGTAASVDDAEDLCEAIGSTLAIVKDSDDLEIYRQAWEDEGLPYCGVWNCDGQSAIALYDKDTEGTFTWGDGTAYDGSIPTFGVGEPNDLYGEDCVTMSFTSSTDATLTYANDIGCEYEFGNELYVFCNEDPCNPFTPSPTECNGGYEYVGQADSVNDARTLCENIGSTLATVNSDADVAIYRQALDDESIPQTGSWNGLGQTAIGLGDSADEGVYVWDDGTECKLNSNLCYDYWGGGEPNDSGGEDCVTFSFPSDLGTYSNDIDCDYSFPNQLYVFCNVECDDDCDKYIYVDEPMSFEDAQAYCESEYGTSLAGVNEDDIPEANCAITDPGEPTWVGLYSETDPAFFEFVSGEECDIPFSGACVDFWGTFNKGERAPQCLKEGGFQCGYYRESSELVYNNLDCETEAPFLCEKYPVSSAAHNGLFSEIKDYIDGDVNGKNGSNENNFYMTIITSIAGVILIITLFIECIYCLCKSKNKNEKVPYDKLGSEI